MFSFDSQAFETVAAIAAVVASAAVVVRGTVAPDPSPRARRRNLGLVVAAVSALAVAAGSEIAAFLSEQDSEELSIDRVAVAKAHRHVAAAPTTEIDVELQIEQTRTRLIQLEAQLMVRSAVLAKRLERLTAARSELETDDLDAVEAFAAEAAIFEAHYQARKQSRTEIVQLRKQLSELMDRRDRERGTTIRSAIV